jgi:alkanesulfonate monooxygenase SsuD/methylene tetrahydromethanopterin reductase-like flavin-dependent oxidoreductase (luciferase family)
MAKAPRPPEPQPTPPAASDAAEAAAGVATASAAPADLDEHVSAVQDQLAALQASGKTDITFIGAYATVAAAIAALADRQARTEATLTALSA